MAKGKSVFSEEELGILVSSLVEKTTRKQAYKFIQWCTEARIKSYILRMILEGGRLTKVGHDGEPSYGGKKAIESGQPLRLPKPESIVKIGATNKEYRLLLNMLQMADWILHAHVVNPPDDEYTALIQKFMALAKDYECDDLVNYDEKQKRYEPTNEYFFSDEIHGPMDEHDDGVFWDILVDRLARRDLMQEIGLKEYAKLDRLERSRRLLKALEKYNDEFSTHGLKRLELPKTDEGKKVVRKAKTTGTPSQ